MFENKKIENFFIFKHYWEITNFFEIG